MLQGMGPFIAVVNYFTGVKALGGEEGVLQGKVIMWDTFKYDDYFTDDMIHYNLSQLPQPAGAYFARYTLN